MTEYMLWFLIEAYLYQKQTKSFWGVEHSRHVKADNLTAIPEPTVLTVWDLTTL
jgi:hypothetical protein